MNKLLITGASGFLGKRGAVYFTDHYTVITPTYRELDITNGSDVAQKIAEYRPNIVLHCTAIPDIGTCEHISMKSWDINVTGCINIAGAAGQVRTKYILCSSDRVYFDSVQTEPHKKTKCLSLKNLYEQEKLAAEMRCLAADPDCVLLRLSWMHDCQTISDHKHGGFLRTLLPHPGISEQLSFPILTDINEAIPNLKPAFHPPGGVYNFGVQNHMSTFDLMQQVFSQLGLDEGLLAENIRVFSDNPGNLCMDIENLQAFGISFPLPQTDWYIQFPLAFLLSGKEMPRPIPRDRTGHFQYKHTTKLRFPLCTWHYSASGHPDKR